MTDPADALAAFEDARARLDELVAESRDRSARAARVADHALETATARSPRGEVTVTAQAGGIVRAMEFSDAGFELGPAALARLAVQTIAQAQHAAAQRFAESASSELGADSPIAAQLRADAERAFPEPGGSAIR